ncbi:protein DD3-3-like [Argonauta hians]
MPLPRWCCLLAVLCAIVAVHCDIYSHNPRGSNNRLNENNANRANANRLFDSQNNNRGGYNVGDRTAAPAKDVEDQYQMRYFQSSAVSRTTTNQGKSYLSVEWTNQHGCGTDNDLHPSKRQCNVVLQYMCQKIGGVDSRDELRDGLKTNTQAFAYRTGPVKDKKTYLNYKSIVKQEFGLHESWDYYDKCFQRERNEGLFTADQKLRVMSGYRRAITTRQNPNGARRGYECPEEKDYYPYWHPTPWMDIAVFAQKAEYCKEYIHKSFNHHPYGECVEFFPDGSRRHASRWNSAFECKCNKGTWVQFSSYLEKATQYTSMNACVSARKTDHVPYVWGVPYDAVNVTKKECLVPPDKPHCAKAPFNRLNHLGNGMNGQTNSYTWKLPHVPSGDELKCVYRIRYNISTDDYNPWTTTAEDNKDDEQDVESPVENDPEVEVGDVKLQLAINTAQFGRTFQDRSHVFFLSPRPKNLTTENIHNLNVRGKRGNIVQTFPAVEYDFVPNTLALSSKDLLHVQWTGSNTHKNQGQGNDGEGTDGTDRTNIVQMATGGVSYPMSYKDTTLWANSRVEWIYNQHPTMSPKDLAVNMASSGYYACADSTTCPAYLASSSIDKKKPMNSQLNNAPASYPGALLRIKKGVYNYMCTRNNNFSNRAQKGVIVVKE